MVMPEPIRATDTSPIVVTEKAIVEGVGGQHRAQLGTVEVASQRQVVDYDHLAGSFL